MNASVPLSPRLRLCAELVVPGSRVCDIGCDHGYLGISLLLSGAAASVIAADVREKPLRRAMENAERFGVGDAMTFVLSDGLDRIPPSSDCTVVAAGLGGDAIADIVERCDWVRSTDCTLVLQPQSSGNDLRRRLSRDGWRIEQERLVKDKGFVYSAMVCRYGGGRPLTPGEQYISPALLCEPAVLLEEYASHVLHGLTKAVEGLRRSGQEKDRLRLDYYQTALREVREMLSGQRAVDPKAGIRRDMSCVF